MPQLLFLYCVVVISPSYNCFIITTAISAAANVLGIYVSYFMCFGLSPSCRWQKEIQTTNQWSDRNW